MCSLLHDVRSLYIVNVTVTGVFRLFQRYTRGACSIRVKTSVYLYLLGKVCGVVFNYFSFVWCVTCSILVSTVS